MKHLFPSIRAAFGLSVKKTESRYTHYYPLEKGNQTPLLALFAYPKGIEASIAAIKHTNRRTRQY